MKFKYSIIVPCYNEGPNLPKLVETLSSFPNTYDVEFILVENGSKDDSFQLMQELIHDKSRFKAIQVKTNKGYGLGIKTGLKTASGDFVAWIHADLQINPLALMNFFDYIESSSSSDKLFMKGKRKNRHVVEYIFTMCMGIFETLHFRTLMYDVMSVPVVMPCSLIKDIDAIPDDFSCDIYTYVYAKRKGCKVIHLPVVLKDREAGESSWNRGLMSRLCLSWKFIKWSYKIKL